MATTGAKFAAQHAALDLLAKAPAGLTATQLGAFLWPGKGHTHLPAGRVVAHLRLAGLVTRSAAGLVQITGAGADKLALLLEARA
jgi:hypothetical protein